MTTRVVDPAGRPRNRHPNRHPVAHPDRHRKRHRVAAALGLAGSLAGVLAGLVQATIGGFIPEWTGAKASPVGLGLLTVGLSGLGAWAALRQRGPDLSVRARAACALAMIGPGLLCLSTVGRLWFPSAVLLVSAGAMSIDGWRDTVRVIVEDRWRLLLSALGACQWLMAAGASPVLMTVGAVGGVALIAAAWLRTASRGWLVGLVVLGTVPFAVLAWAAVVPLLVAATAALIAIPVLRQRSEPNGTTQPDGAEG